MKFKFSSFVLSALLSTSIAAASNIKLSDAYNGFIPEEIKKDAGKLKAHQEEIISKFGQKLHDLMSMQDQLERFYAPYARKGGEHERVMANAVCDFVEAKVQKVGFVKELYEGHLGEVKDYLGSADKMKGQPHKIGQHAALIKKVKGIDLEIEKTQKSIQDQPAQKTAWEQEIVKKKETIEALGKALGTLEKQIFGNEAALTEKQGLIKANQEEIHEAEQLLSKCSDEIIKLEADYKERKASITPLVKPIKAKDEVDASSETENSQEEPVEEQNLQVDRAAQELKDLEADYIAKDQKLKDKKGESFARATEMREKQIGLQTQRDTFIKEKEAFEQEHQDKKGQISKEEREIDSLNEKIKAQSEEKRKLESALKQLFLDKQQKQDEADTYALIKYLTLLNIYSALPNDDFDYHGYKNPLTTLSFDALPTIIQLVNKRAAYVGNENVRLVLDREMPKFQASVDKYIAGKSQKFEDEVVAEAEKRSVGYMEDYRRPVAKVAFSTMQRIASGENIVNNYKTTNKERTHYYPLPIKDEEFLKAYSSEMDLLRADHQLKVAMTKWRSKISTTAGSLVQRLGLDSALFNPDYSITSYPHFLSFPELHDSLKDTALIPYPARLKENDVWSLGRMQLRTNFFEALNGKDEKVWRRISPVVRFVESKQDAQSISKESVPAASSAATQLPLAETKQSGFKHLLNSDQDADKSKAVEHAYLKYVSYVNMLQALRYDGEGSKMPQLRILDSAVESLLREQLPTEIRLDNVMAAKAHKWGLRVQEYGEKFIQKNGLLAHIFMPIFKDKAH